MRQYFRERDSNITIKSLMQDAIKIKAVFPYFSLSYLVNSLSYYASEEGRVQIILRKLLNKFQDSSVETFNRNVHNTKKRKHVKNQAKNIFTETIELLNEDSANEEPKLKKLCEKNPKEIIIIEDSSSDISSSSDKDNMNVFHDLNTTNKKDVNILQNNNDKIENDLYDNGNNEFHKNSNSNSLENISDLQKNTDNSCVDFNNVNEHTNNDNHEISKTVFDRLISNRVKDFGQILIKNKSLKNPRNSRGIVDETHLKNKIKIKTNSFVTSSYEGGIKKVINQPLNTENATRIDLLTNVEQLTIKNDPFEYFINSISKVNDTNLKNKVEIRNETNSFVNSGDEDKKKKINNQPLDMEDATCTDLLTNVEQLTIKNEPLEHFNWISEIDETNLRNEIEIKSETNENEKNIVNIKINKSLDKEDASSIDLLKNVGQLTIKNESLEYFNLISKVEDFKNNNSDKSFGNLKDKLTKTVSSVGSCNEIQNDSDFKVNITIVPTLTKKIANTKTRCDTSSQTETISVKKPIRKNNITLPSINGSTSQKFSSRSTHTYPSTSKERYPARKFHHLRNMYYDFLNKENPTTLNKLPTLRKYFYQREEKHAKKIGL